MNFPPKEARQLLRLYERELISDARRWKRIQSKLSGNELRDFKKLCTFQRRFSKTAIASLRKQAAAR